MIVFANIENNAVSAPFGFYCELVCNLLVLVVDGDGHLFLCDLYVGGKAQFFCLQVYDFGVDAV